MKKVIELFRQFVSVYSNRLLKSILGELKSGKLRITSIGRVSSKKYRNVNLALNNSDLLLSLLFWCQWRPHSGTPASPGLSRRRSWGQWACFWRMKKRKENESVSFQLSLKTLSFKFN